MRFSYSLMAAICLTAQMLYPMCNPCGITLVQTRSAGSGPAFVAYSPNGRCVAVSSSFDNTVLTFSRNQDCVLCPTGALPTGGGQPMGLAFSPIDNCLAVANASSNSVSIFTIDPDCCTLTPVESPVPTGVQPIGLAFSPNGQCLAVANNLSGNISIFSVNSNCKLSPVPGSPFTSGGTPRSVAFSPTGSCLVVAGGTANGVFVFKIPSDCSPAVPPTLVPTGGTLTVSVAFSSTGCLAAVNGNTNDVTMFTIDETTCTLNKVSGPGTNVRGNYDTGNEPVQAAFSPNGSCLAITNEASSDNSISLFMVNPDCTLTSVGTPIPSGGKQPLGLAYSPDGQCLTVANVLSNSIVTFQTNFIITPIVTSAVSNCFGNVMIVGTTSPGVTVIVSEGGNTIGSATSDCAGTFIITTTTPLSPGIHTLTVTATNTTTGCSVSSTITVTSFLPSTPHLSTVTPNCNGTLTVTGTADANSTINVLVNGGSIGTGTSDASGHFSFTTNGSIPNGTFIVMVQSINSAGCFSGFSNAIEVTVNQAIRPVICVTVNCPNVTITGVTSPNAKVTIFVDNVPVATVMADNQGNFTFTTKLAKGIHQINADAISSSGCPSGISNTVTVKVNNKQAQRPAICATVKGRHVHINGTAEPDSKVTIFVDDKKIRKVHANAHGNFTLKVKLHEGHHEITARSKDKFGCKSKTSNKVEVEVEEEHEHDHKHEHKHEHHHKHEDKHHHEHEHKHEHEHECKHEHKHDHEKEQRPVICATVLCPNVTINGSAEKESEVTIFANGRKIGTTIADDKGDFTFKTQLVDGTYRVTAQSEGTSEHKSKVSNSVTVVINCQAKLAITLNSPDAPVTSDHRPTLLGTVTAQNAAVVTRAVSANSVERLVTILADGNILGTTQSDSDGHFTFVPREVLSAGTHTFRAVIMDNGNTVVSNQVQIIIQEQPCNQLVASLITKLCP